MNPILKARLWAAVLLVLLLAVWEGAGRLGGISALVLPVPSAVLQALWAGPSFGLLAGMALAESVLLERVLRPYVVISQVVPKLALAPLFVLWFGFGMLPTVLITALVCFFPLMENTLTGLRQVDVQRLQLFRMLGASRLQTLLRLKLPTGLPAILAGLRVAVVLALVGAVVAEFMGASQGLGAVVIAAQGMMDTTLMFAALLLIAVLGLLLYQACLLLERRLLRRHAVAGPGR